MLLLSIIWTSAAAPYDTKRPARWWAELIGLEDPAGNGARSIRNSLKELEARGFIRLESNAETGVPTVHLLDESRTGASYTVPGSFALKADESETVRYFRIPETFWTSGLCTQLSGPALAMYLIALSVGGRPEGQFFWFSPALFRERYGLGDSTRKKGLRELVDRDILTARAVSTDPSGLTVGRTYNRIIYLVAEEHRSRNVVVE